MARAQDITRSSRARPCRFKLPDGREIVIKPPSVDQSLECLRLDPEPGKPETPFDELKRLWEQAHILLGPEHAHLTSTLDKWELAQIVGVVYVAACGLDAEGYARWQLAERQAKRHRETMEIIEELERATTELAANRNCFADEVGARPLADIVALQESLQKARQAEIDFQRALHGMLPA